MRFLWLLLLLILGLIAGAFLFLAGLFSASAPMDDRPPTPPSERPMMQEPTIADIAIRDGRFGTLVTALKAANLVEAVADREATLTVFAPTDEAFRKLPPGTLDALLADIPALTNVLLYHVLGEELLAADLVRRDRVETLTGEEIRLSVVGQGGLSLILNEDTRVIISDIRAANGVIHVIDMVLLPTQAPADLPPAGMPEPEAEPSLNLVETAQANPDFSILVTAVEAAGLVETLSDADAAFTVFAPTNEAFDTLPAGALEDLLADPEALTDVLLYHVVKGRVLAKDVVEVTEVIALNNKILSVRVDGDDVFINEARILATDIEASNGVIHVIDAVLLPPVE